MALLTGNSELYIKSTEHWFCRGVEAGLLPEDYPDQPFLVWLISMENAVLQFIGSVGAIGPTNPTEFIYFLVSLTMGVLMLASVQAVFVRMLTTADPDETYLSQSMDALNFMMRDTRMPRDIRHRVRDYFRKSKKMLKRMSCAPRAPPTRTALAPSNHPVLLTRRPPRALSLVCPAQTIRSSTAASRTSFVATPAIRSHTRSSSRSGG